MIALQWSSFLSALPFLSSQTPHRSNKQHKLGKSKENPPFFYFGNCLSLAMCCYSLDVVFLLHLNVFLTLFSMSVAAHAGQFMCHFLNIWYMTFCANIDIGFSHSDYVQWNWHRKCTIMGKNSEPDATRSPSWRVTIPVDDRGEICIGTTRNHQRTVRWPISTYINLIDVY